MDRKIRVLHVVSCLGTGGVEKFLLNIYRSMDKNSIQFDFLTHRDGTLVEKEFISLGSQVYQLSFRRKHPFKSAIQAYKIFKNTEYDIIHFHGNIESVLQMFMAFLAGKKIRICHTHTFFISPSFKKKIINWISQRLLSLVGTHYFSCSRSAGEWGIGKRFKETGKCKVIYSGINIDEFKFNEEMRKRTREKLGVKQNFVLGHIGRFMDEKNHEFVIKVFADIAGKYDNSILLLIGEGETKKNVENEIPIHLKEKVFFLGERTDINELLMAMDVFIFPSKNEGLGMVLIEAQATGLSCYVSENVPTDVKISNLVTFLPINKGHELWSEAIKIQSTIRRWDYNSYIKNSGFDITKGSGYLQEIYNKILHGEDLSKC
ncbi:glycosyltransferase family 1 protein [Paenibacillus sp. NPDC058177]|uniref:glycosyltransferase family 1 protein n=1 Tax=Paenibacillus sp. NPDC058177 TaxID=3346369 RepID=UPI0036DE0DE1